MFSLLLKCNHLQRKAEVVWVGNSPEKCHVLPHSSLLVQKNEGSQQLSTGDHSAHFPSSTRTAAKEHYRGGGLQEDGSLRRKPTSHALMLGLEAASAWSEATIITSVTATWLHGRDHSRSHRSPVPMPGQASIFTQGHDTFNLLEP